MSPCRARRSDRCTRSPLNLMPTRPLRRVGRLNTELEVVRAFQEVAGAVRDRRVHGRPVVELLAAGLSIDAREAVALIGASRRREVIRIRV